MTSYLSLPLSIMLNYTDLILKSATLTHTEYHQLAMQASLKSRRSVYKSLFHISRQLLTKIKYLHRARIFSEGTHFTNAEYQHMGFRNHHQNKLLPPSAEHLRKSLTTYSKMWKRGPGL